MSENSKMEEQIALLTKQLNELQNRVDHAPAKSEEKLVSAAKNDSLPDESDFGEPEDISEEILSWADRAALLPRIAALCFMLVFALVLRTLTDNQLIPTAAGSVIGIGYATSLMLASWYFYSKKSALAPIFAACGAVLIGTIVVETHMKFKSLPLVPAYLALMASGIWSTIISYRFKNVIPVSVGTLAMGIAGAAMDYPHPYFPYMGLILVTANLMGFYAATIKRCSWLRWIVLIVTFIMMQLWVMRISISISRGMDITPDLALNLALPFMGLFAILLPLLSLMGVLRSGEEQVSKFDFSLPSLSGLWAYFLIKQLFAAQSISLQMLGAFGAAFAAIHLAASWSLANRSIEKKPGTNSFAFAGALILAISVPDLFGSYIYAVPIISATAVLLLYLSQKWESGGVRYSSYIVQIYSAVVISLASAPNENLQKSAAMIALAAVFSFAAALYHYIASRKTPPPLSSAIFELDRNDFGGVIPLVSSLLSIFVAFRGALYVFSTNSSAIFQGGQTVAINAGATALVIIAYRLCCKEIRNIAILITIIAAFKVFMVDLVQVKGLPVVLSVFSFGLSAAIESIILGKWKKGCRRDFLTETKP